MTFQIDSLTRRLQIVDIRSLSGDALEPLLWDQRVDWELELDWDFLKTADLVRRFANARTLVGSCTAGSR
jgi:hypothetical protein